MDYGMPTLLELSTIEDNARLCRELGLAFVEINMNMPLYQINKLKNIDLRAGDIFYTIHLDENMDPFHFNPDVAAAWTRTALDAALIARNSGMPVINMHFPMGVHFKLPAGKVYLWDSYWEHLRDSICRFRDEMTKEADGEVLICVENTVFGSFAHYEDALALLLESPAFALTYDCGHDMTDGMKAREYYLDHVSRLRHMHLHDATETRCHLPLGEGMIDIPGLRALANNCRMVIEVKDSPGLRSSVSYIREHSLF